VCNSVVDVPRHRLGVALLVPPPVGDEIDGLRRACGDGAFGRIPPHLTLVPPVNVRAEHLGRALAVVRDAAAGSRHLRVGVGPPDTFLPVNPTLFLRVGGEEPTLERLRELRDRLFVPPLERDLPWAFVPHVTLADGIDVDRLRSALLALADYSCEVEIDRVHLLEERRGGNGVRRWHPLADYPLRPKAIVGRGGLPLELTVSGMADPEVLAFEASQPDTPPPPDRPNRSDALVAAARREGEVIGAAHGWTDGTEVGVLTVLVGVEHRGQGIGRHLHAALVAEPGRRQATGSI
jgi:2'-5' RNA ligase